MVAIATRVCAAMTPGGTPYSTMMPEGSMGRKRLHKQSPLLGIMNTDGVIGDTEDFPGGSPFIALFITGKGFDTKIGFRMIIKNNDLPQIMDHGADADFL